MTPSSSSPFPLPRPSVEQGNGDNNIMMDDPSLSIFNSTSSPSLPPPSPSLSSLSAKRPFPFPSYLSSSPYLSPSHLNNNHNGNDHYDDHHIPKQMNSDHDGDNDNDHDPNNDRSFSSSSSSSPFPSSPKRHKSTERQDHHDNDNSNNHLIMNPHLPYTHNNHNNNNHNIPDIRINQNGRENEFYDDDNDDHDNDNDQNEDGDQNRNGSHTPISVSSDEDSIVISDGDDDEDEEEDSSIHGNVSNDVEIMDVDHMNGIPPAEQQNHPSSSWSSSSSSLSLPSSSASSEPFLASSSLSPLHANFEDSDIHPEQSASSSINNNNNNNNNDNSNSISNNHHNPSNQLSQNPPFRAFSSSSSSLSSSPIDLTEEDDEVAVIPNPKPSRHKYPNHRGALSSSSSYFPSHKPSLPPSWSSSSSSSSSPSLPHRADEVSLLNDSDSEDSFTVLYGTALVTTNIIPSSSASYRPAVGDSVHLFRMPNHPQSRHVIRVDSPSSVPFCYIESSQSSVLSPFIDASLIETKCKISHTSPLIIRIDIFGLELTRDEVERAIQDAQTVTWITSRRPEYLRWKGANFVNFVFHEKSNPIPPNVNSVPPPKYNQTNGFPPIQLPPSHLSLPFPHPQMPMLIPPPHSHSYGPDIRAIENDLDKLFDNDSDFSRFPLADVPSIIRTMMYPYQRQGLQWMKEREHLRSDNDKILFWDKLKNGKWVSKIDGMISTNIPEQGRGGILADEMGLGKTLQTVALVASTIEQQRKAMKGGDSEGNQNNSSVSQSSSSSLLSPPRPSNVPLSPSSPSVVLSSSSSSHRDRGGTLIVCPLSVLTNWTDQIDKHCKKNSLNYFVYHGPNRDKNIRQMRKVDVVITTYDIVRSEYNGPEGEEENGDDEKSNSLLGQQEWGPPSTYPPYSYEWHKAAQYEKKKKKAEKAEEKKSRQSRNPECSPLFFLLWFRIILDEAHCIRERKTQQSKASASLKGTRRWAVTGTPLQNRIEDMYSLLLFLRVQPFVSFRVFTKFIMKPIKERDKKGLDRLQQIIATICLRRKKTDEVDGKRVLSLPPKESIVVSVKLTDKEEALYEILSVSGKKSFQRMFEDRRVGQSFARILEMLLRMRQSCNHTSLVPSHYHSGFGEGETSMDKLRHLETLFTQLADSCVVCNGNPNEPMIAICGCFYCTECAISHISQQKAQRARGVLSQFGANGHNNNPSSSSSSSTTFSISCGGCGSEIDESSIYSQDAIRSVLRQDELRAKLYQQEDNDSNDHLHISSKCLALIDSLKYSTSIGEKSIVFSQWTSFLDIVGVMLDHSHIKWVRLDGSMQSAVRVKSLRDFDSDPTITVFLISLKAGGVGLNLTAANRCFLVDPWWNPAAEDQATDRIHRLGQTRPVQIIRIIAEDTVEEKIIQLQNKKREMTSHALLKVGKTKQQQQEERINDLSFLFGTSSITSLAGGKRAKGKNDMGGEDSHQSLETIASKIPNTRVVKYDSEEYKNMFKRNHNVQNDCNNQSINNNDDNDNPHQGEEKEQKQSKSSSSFYSSPFTIPALFNSPASVRAPSSSSSSASFSLNHIEIEDLTED